MPWNIRPKGENEDENEGESMKYYICSSAGAEMREYDRADVRAVARALGDERYREQGKEGAQDYNLDERVDSCVWYVVKVKVEKKVLIESSVTYLCHDDAIGNIANYG